MLGKTMYLVSGVVALVVALVCAMFSFGAGLGWGYLLPSGAAVLLVVVGLIRSPGDRAAGAALPGAGAALCAMVLLGGLAELVRAIPFREQPGQATMLVGPLLLLGVSLLHAGVAFWRWRGNRGA